MWKNHSKKIKAKTSSKENMIFALKRKFALDFIF